MSVSTSTKIMRIESKVFDVDTLRQQYELLNIHTPKVEEKLRQGYEATKELSGYIPLNDFEFQLVWPQAYPDSASLCLTISSASTVVDDINKAIHIFACAFVGCQNGCAADIMTYAIELISEIPPSAPPTCTVSLHVLKYNHLLLGSEHKKEKAMVSLAKKTITGGVCYGTPGLVLLLGADEDFVSSYLSDCRGIGKKGDLVFHGVNCFPDISQSKADQEADTEGSKCSREDVLGGRRSGGGFLELTTAEVQTCMGGVEVFKQHVLQM